MVVGLCRLLLRDTAEAEDASQQAFLSAYRSLLSGVEPREPAAWLATIARNECRSRIRARMREPLAEPEVPTDLPDPLAAAVRNADLSALWQALSELPRQQRKAILLREFSGLSYGELAAALAVSEPAVESLLFRARRELRGRLRATLAPVNGALAIPIALRDYLTRMVPGFDAPSTGALAKIASLPIAAKLAAAGTSAALLAGTTVAVVRVPHRPAAHSKGSRAARAPAQVVPFSAGRASAGSSAFHGDGPASVPGVDDGPGDRAEGGSHDGRDEGLAARSEAERAGSERASSERSEPESGGGSGSSGDDSLQTEQPGGGSGDSGDSGGSPSGD